VLLADSMAARYQRHRLEQEAARAGALETAALSQLRANVKFIASTVLRRLRARIGARQCDGCAAAQGDCARRACIRASGPAVDGAADARPSSSAASSVVAAAAPEVFRYRFEARTPDYARLFSRYMHVRS
jgi:hypothetical protein